MSTRKRSGSGCFSAVLHRILCLGSPKTHPSDDIVELNSTVVDDHVAKVQVQDSKNGTGIVARLMGLDSLPENNWVEKERTTAGFVARRRSVDFVVFDLTKAKHHGVKTSSSFGEVMESSQLLQHNQKQELYLDNVDENNEDAELMFKLRKSEKGDGSSSTSKHVTQKENVREKVACKKEIKRNKEIAKLENEPKRAYGKGKQSLNKSKLKKIESSSESSSSNPVSVLHVNGSATRQENRISEDSSSTLELIKSEKKHESLTNAHVPTNLEIEETTDQYCMELVGKPDKLAEEEIKNSKWISNKMDFSKLVEFDEVCGKFGQQILDPLLYEVVDDLAGII